MAVAVALANNNNHINKSAYTVSLINKAAYSVSVTAWALLRAYSVRALLRAYSVTAWALLRSTAWSLLRGPCAAWYSTVHCTGFLLCKGGNRQTQVTGTSTIHYCIKHEIT